jgi:hypothetical protein
MMLPAGAAVGSLQVLGARQDTPALRAAVERSIAGAELEPPGMAPAAILIVRRLADPLPERLSARRPGADPVWEHACRESLENLLRRAARPAGGTIPPDGEAVVFADEAELLACLARDRADGTIGEHWWWRRLPASLRAAPLAASPRAVPGVLSLLRSWGRAVEVVAALPGEAARELLSAVLHAYGLRPVLPGGPAAPAADPTGPLGTAAVAAPGSSPRSWAVPGGGPWWPPPAPLAAPPAAAAGLGPAQAVLLAVALTLGERPALAGSPAFREALERWWAVRAGLGPPAGGAASGGRGPAPAPAPAGPAVPWQPPEPPVGTAAEPAGTDGGAATGAAGPPDAPPHPAPAPGAGDPGDEPAAPPPALPAGPPPAGLGERPPDVAGAPVEADPAGTELGGPGPTDWPNVPGHPGAPDPADGPGPYSHPAGPGAVEDATGPAGQPETAAPAGPALPGLLAEGVGTDLAGVLYLLNAFRRLDLPASLEQAWPPGLELGGWALLDVVARGLLTAEPGPRNPADLAADPLWGALAVLAGRDPGALIGEGCHGRHGHGLPGSWAAGGDVPNGHGPPATSPGANGHSPPATVAGGNGQLPAERLLGPLMAPVGGCPRRWLAVAVPFLRHWLAEALGLPAGWVAAELLRTGRLYVTSTHVDAVLRLDDISLPARIAGLDADPGWCPQLGRVVQFHFE